MLGMNQTRREVPIGVHVERWSRLTDLEDVDDLLASDLDNFLAILVRRD